MTGWVQLWNQLQQARVAQPELPAEAIETRKCARCGAYFSGAFLVDHKHRYLHPACFAEQFPERIAQEEKAMAAPVPMNEREEAPCL